MIAPHLQVFVMVAETKNFSRAAERLALTQPAVSQQVGTLEDYYGVKLFERSSKRVELTRAGELLLPYAREILNTADVARESIQGLLERVAGKLEIGATLTIGDYVLPRVLAEFVRLYPDVEVQVRIANTEEIGQSMVNHRVDIGLAEGRLEDRRLVLTPFLEDEMVLLASPAHPLAAKGRVTAEELAGETFVMREAGSGTRAMAEEVLRRLGAKPRKRMVISSTHAIKEAVENGIGLTLLSKWCVQRERQYGTLVSLQAEDGAFTRPLVIVERAQQFQTRTVQAFRELVVRFGERERSAVGALEKQ